MRTWAFFHGSRRIGMWVQCGRLVRFGVTMAWFGFSLVVLAGVLWAGMAVVVASAGRHRCGMDTVQPLSALFVLLVGGGLKVCGVGASSGVTSGCEWLPEAAWLAASLVALAGLGNYLMLIFVQRAMAVGPSGVVWAFTQSSLIWPFVVGMTVFGEAPTAGRLGGTALIVVALCLFSRVRGGVQQESGLGGMGWLRLTLMAFVLSGFAQTAASLPSYMGLAGLRPLERSLLLNAGIVASAAGAALVQRGVPPMSLMAVWHALAFAAMNLLSQVLMYLGMDRLASASCAGIAYPVAQGVSIGMFFVWQSFQSRVPWMGIAGLLVLLAGIVLCGLG